MPRVAFTSLLAVVTALAGCTSAAPGRDSAADGNVTIGIFPHNRVAPVYQNSGEEFPEMANTSPGSHPGPLNTDSVSEYADASPLALGRTLTVKLPGNPTTGYMWTLTSGDPKILQPQGEPVYTPVRTGMVGSGGEYTFKFLAVARGNATLQFGYLRPWEKDVPPVKTYKAVITVP